MTAAKPITILDLMSGLLREWFKPRWLRGDSWAAWKVFLSAVFALPMDAQQLATFTKHTGRATSDADGYQKIFALVGRGGGKSIIAATIAIFLAVFKTYETVPGESLVGMVIATDRRQAKIVHAYIKAFLTRVPALQKLVVNETADSISIKNGDAVIRIETHSSDFRSLRGYSLAFLIADEIAFWATDESAASPDVEVLNACEPALARVPGSILLAISSPYSEKGEAWRAYREHWGKDSSTLIWRGATLEMNPRFSEKVIKRALAEDYARASAEYLAEFRADLADFISRLAVESVVVAGRRELGAGGGFGIQYVAFYDASGGVRDSAVLSIAHHANGLAILDCIRETEAPFSPASAVQEHAQVLKSYGCYEIWGDKYSGEWCADEFRRQGVEYRFSALDRSAIYLFALAQINSGRCELLDDERLVNQLCGLKRRTGSQGRDTIDHQAGAHDDRANSACGALFLARDAGGINSLIEYERDALAGKYSGDSEAARKFRESWKRAEQAIAGYKGAPTRETWMPGVRGFKFGEKPPVCPQCGSSENVIRLQHSELQCRNPHGEKGEAHQFWKEGEKPAVNFGGDRGSYQPSAGNLIERSPYWRSMDNFRISRGGR